MARIPIKKMFMVFFLVEEQMLEQIEKHDTKDAILKIIYHIPDNKKNSEENLLKEKKEFFLI